MPLLNEGDVFCGVTAEHLEMAEGQLCKWPGKEITYSFAAYLGELGKDTQRGLTRAAFDVVQKACGLKIRESDDPTSSHIRISAGRGSRMNFDGPSGILAWCELPCGNPTQCDLVLDLDENWVASNAIGAGILYLRS